MRILATGLVASMGVLVAGCMILDDPSTQGQDPVVQGLDGSVQEHTPPSRGGAGPDGEPVTVRPELPGAKAPGGSSSQPRTGSIPESAQTRASQQGPASSEQVPPAGREERWPRSIWPTAEVFVPQQVFKGSGRLDRQVLASNPRLYLYPDFDPSAPHLLIVGMPGWGGRSENFIWTMINGLKGSGLTHRLVLAAIQDPLTQGPGYQGQGEREHANVWSLDSDSLRALHHLVSRVARRLGPLPTEVYFLGFSTGATAAPVVAGRVAQLADEPGLRIRGAISLGSGSQVPARLLLATGQRVLFLVVPPRRSGDPEPLRDDHLNRESAEYAQRLLAQQGADVHLRHIASARQQQDWHWGLISPCRFFPAASRVDAGRGYWPNYWMPNPETSTAIAAFVRGEIPPPSETPTAGMRCLF